MLIGIGTDGAVRRRFPTAAARVRSQVRSFGICGIENDTGCGVSAYSRFPRQYSFPELLHIY